VVISLEAIAQMVMLGVGPRQFVSRQPSLAAFGESPVSAVEVRWPVRRRAHFGGAAVNRLDWAEA
jgi:hypothetical protein